MWEKFCYLERDMGGVSRLHQKKYTREEASPGAA